MEDGRERDGVFITDDFVNLIECTISKSKQKAEEDGEKLVRLAKRLGAQHPTKHVKGWFITLNEPTAEQRSVIDKKRDRLVAVSFDQFRARLLDARSYLTLREAYPFGSVRDPETGLAQTSLDYVSLGIVDDTAHERDVAYVAEELGSGRRFVLLGDYGAGKSSTMRELYLRLAKRFWGNKTLVFPLLINLRDHHGQIEPTEAIERHARRIGFTNPSHLVRAWRAGYACVMLDGFDEIATAGWVGRTKTLKDLRYRSMELLRAFVRESPSQLGIIIAGRAHFFDNDRELGAALGVSNAFIRLSLNEFTPRQVYEYLKKRGWEDAVPDWLPSRPLLLGYLASRGLLKQTLYIDAGSSPALGWHKLLERISEREAEIEAGIDADTVRRLIEHLATIARVSADGLGPLLPDQITAAFTTVCGYPPDDRGVVLIQRLPGLGGHSAEDGARVFIDRDLAAAAAAGGVFRFVENPYLGAIEPENWLSVLSPLGLEVLAIRSYEAGFASAKLSAAAGRATQLTGGDTLAADILLALHEMGMNAVGAKTFVREVIVPRLAFDSDCGDMSLVEWQDAVIARLEIGTDVDDSLLPTFTRCFIDTIDGRTGEGELPAEKFIECTIDQFEERASTTNALLQLSLPLGTKVLLTVLKKLYAQRGTGRKESALFRGLDHRAREFVPSVLTLLRREGFAVKSRLRDTTVWLPARGADIQQRAARLLAAPHSSDDALVRLSADLG